MVEVKAYVEKEGVSAETHIEGFGEDIAAEVLTIVATLMREIKSESLELHLMIINAIARDKSILLGDMDCDIRKEMN